MYVDTFTKRARILPLHSTTLPLSYGAGFTCQSDRRTRSSRRLNTRFGTIITTTGAFIRVVGSSMFAKIISVHIWPFIACEGIHH